MKFRLKECPRCEQKAYEKLESYGVCHECNLNTVEGYSWDKFQDWELHRPKLSLIKGRLSEIQSIQLCDALARSFSKAPSTRTDRSIVWRELSLFPKIHREIFALWHLDNLSFDQIAQKLGLNSETIKVQALELYEYLKRACYDKVAFSKNPSDLIECATSYCQNTLIKTAA